MHNISFAEILFPRFKIEKPVRLIELFAGVGSQAMALRNIGVDFEHYKVVEFDRFAINSYNAIHGTDFGTLDTTQIKGQDLAIEETDKYCYIMTYSFPCQDLSIAGKRAGMSKESGTRSGLLWEVERLLNECENLPQVLLMENVPQVLGQKNISDFRLWQTFLENKGYSNYVKNFNAKDYGVAQNRERTFMVSLLGDWFYDFPKPKPLTKKVKDYLEEKINERFYVNNAKTRNLINQLVDSGGLKSEKEGTGVSLMGSCYGGVHDVSRCDLARDKCGFGNQEMTGVAELIQVGNIASNGNGWDNPQAGRVYSSEGISPTINTQCKVATYNLKSL